MRISVVLCTYNGEKYVSEQLLSVIRQKRQPDELIIIDDCSTDNTLKIIKDDIQQYNGDVYIQKNNNNLGFRENFSYAISKATGDIIFLCDQDDVWEENKISVILDYFKNENTTMVFHDVELVDSNLNDLGMSFWENMEFDDKKRDNLINLLWLHDFIQGAACAFRKEVKIKALPIPKRAFHDEWLGLISLLLGEIVCVPKKLGVYRQSNFNALGAGKIGIENKVLYWGLNLKRNLRDRKKEIYRRKYLLSIIKSKVNDEKREIINDCETFLNSRITFINERQIYSLYKLYCRNKKYIKSFYRDLLMDSLLMLN